MGKDDATPGGIDRQIARFSDRLDSILGKGRIPRREKKAKAKSFLRAVDDLIEAVEVEIERINIRDDI